MKKFLALPILALMAGAALTLVGCGGSGGGGTAVGALYEGTYSTGYTRVNGSSSVSIESTGLVSVAINDDDSGLFTGTGQLSTEGEFSIEATNGSAMLMVSGTVTGSKTATERSVDVTTTGALALTLPNMERVGAASVASFAGSYSGVLSGDLTGTWIATISPTGQITGTVTSGQSSYEISGTLSLSGALKLTGTGAGAAAGESINWDGLIVRSLNSTTSASGVWSTSELALGVWTGGSVDLQ